MVLLFGAGTKGGVAPLIQQMAPLYKNAAEKFLDSENEKSDYDWYFFLTFQLVCYIAVCMI